jgi:hypothetical protein
MELSKKERELLTKAMELVNSKQLALPETAQCTREQRALLERLLDARLGLKEVLTQTA